MQINIVSCKTEEDYNEIIKLLKEKYKDNSNCKFREIRDTFIIPDKKWLSKPDYLVKQLTKRKPETKIYTAEVIRNALRKD